METIAQGCPFHKEEVKGSDELKFYCPRCNLLYKRNELKIMPYE